MKKIVCALVLIVFCCRAAYAMDIDGMKQHFLKGEWKDAIREGESLLGRAQRGSPDLDQLYYYLALSYMKDRNFMRTSDICEIILKEFPRSKFVPQAHYVLIDAYAGSGNYAAARACAASFLIKYPGTEHAREVESRMRDFKGRGGNENIAPRAAPEPDSAAAEPDIVLAPDLKPGAEMPPAAGSFWIQVGAFSSGRNADNLASKLRAAAYSAAVSPAVSKGMAIYKVRVGPYYSREEAQAVSVKLSRQGYPTKVVP
jgi:hypothetical protein